MKEDLPSKMLLGWRESVDSNLGDVSIAQDLSESQQEVYGNF